MTSPRLASLALGALLASCSPASEAPKAPPKPSYRLPSMRWLPPLGETIFSYKLENLVDRTSGVLTMRLRSTGESSADLFTGQRSEPLRYQENGILRERTGQLLLRLPADVGATWPAGPGTTARIARAGVRVAVEAGAFEDCLEVVEQHSNPPGTVTTTFCPDVGIARMETAADEPPEHVRLELRSFGKPIDLSQGKPP